MIPAQGSFVERGIARRKPLYAIALVLVALAAVLDRLGVSTWSDVQLFASQVHVLLAQTLVVAAALFLASRPTRSELVVFAAIGAPCEIARVAIEASWHLPAQRILFGFGAWLGVGALVACGMAVLRSREDARRLALARLMAAALLPTFMLLSRIFGDLTSVLNPHTYDSASYAADAALGFAPTWLITRGARAIPGLGATLDAVYSMLPLGAGVVYVTEWLRPKRTRLDLGVSFVVAGLVGGAMYNLVPAIGPGLAFENIPHTFVTPETLSLAPAPMPPDFRNDIPSLHTIWALLICWHARPLGRGVRAFGVAWLVLTLVSTVTTGQHYLIDLPLSVPTAVAIFAACADDVPWKTPARWVPVVIAVAFAALWTVLFRGFPQALLSPELAWGLAVVTTLVPLISLRMLREARAGSADRAVDEAPIAATAPRAHARLAAMTWGLTLLVAASALAKAIPRALPTGTLSAWLSFALLLIAIAAGVRLGRRVAKRTTDRGRASAICQGLTAIALAAASIALPAIGLAYAALAPIVGAGTIGALIGGAALGALVVAPAALLAGAHASLERSRSASSGATLASTLAGGACGVLVAGVLLVPALGALRTVLAASALGVLLALGARRVDDAPTDPEGAREDSPRSRASIVNASVLAALAFALVAVSTRLGEITTGTSVYTDTTRLACIVAALALGCALAEGWLRRGGGAELGASLASVLAAIATAGGTFVWGGVADYFASFQGYPRAASFAAREVVRFFVSAATIAPAIALATAAASLALLSSRASRAASGARTEHVSAGPIVFAAVGLLAGAALEDAIGSRAALEAIGAMLAVVGVAMAIRGARPARVAVGVGAGVTLLLLLAQPTSFDLTELASGTQVYMHRQPRGVVTDGADRFDGLATVAARTTKDGAAVHTLALDGRLVGDDESTHDVTTQQAAALVPLLHTDRRGSALVIGFGTGVPTSVLRAAGFSVTVAEPHRDLARLAERDLAHGGATEGADARLVIAPAREALLADRSARDLVFIGPASPWSADDAPLFARELYELARSRLAPGGVFAGDLQLHRLTLADYRLVLATVRAVFDHVWLYAIGSHALIVACATDCTPDEATAHALEAPALEALVRGAGSLRGLLLLRVLAPSSVGSFLQAGGIGDADLAARASTDDDLRVDYATPRANVRDYASTLDENLRALRAFAPATP